MKGYTPMPLPAFWNVDLTTKCSRALPDPASRAEGASRSRVTLLRDERNRMRPSCLADVSPACWS